MELKSKLFDNINYKNCNWPYVFSITLILAFICGFRIFGIDRDYYDYLNYFNSLLGFDPERLFRFKIGFSYLTKFIASLSKSFTFYLFFISFISLLPKIFLMAKHSRNLSFSILIYVLLILPIQEMTQIRSALAYSLFYLGIYFLNKSKSLIGYFWLIISVTIHISTLSLLLLYFSTKIFIKKEHSIFRNSFSVIILFIGLYIFSIKGSNFIPEGLGNQYLIPVETSQGVTNIFSLRSLSLLTLGSLGLICKKNMPIQANNWINISIYGLIIFYAMPHIKILSVRIMEFSHFSYLLWIDYLPKNTRYLAKIILLITALGNFYLFMRNGYFTKI